MHVPIIRIQATNVIETRSIIFIEPYLYEADHYSLQGEYMQ